jgi:hypothetical protein
MHLPAFSPNLAFQDLVYELFGWALVASAVAALLVGWIRFNRVARRIAATDDEE